MQSTDIEKKSPKALGFRHFPKAHLATIGSLSVALSAMLFLFPSKDVEANRAASLDEPLSAAISRTESHADTQTQTPDISAETAAIQNPTPAEKPEPVKKAWHTETVQSGDNLSLIFHRAGLSDQDLYSFISSAPEAKKLQRIHPGHTLSFKLDSDGKLEAMRYQVSMLEATLFSRTETGFKTTDESKIPDIEMAYREATINNSLFLAGQRVKLDANLIMEMADIFGWDIDFALDIREGDSFKVVYEEKYLDGEKIGTGNILSAQFINQGKTYKAVRYTDTNGFSHYYTPDGSTMRKAFLRSPIDFARISSPFNLNRKHPILNTIRAHKGTDYAASTGTPIKATGDGKVIHAGVKGGYGNAVVIQHSQGYKTLYAHMSKFGPFKVGSRVKQGDIIGYVGSTGLATGPHLHYEFYVNGTVRNPVTVALPNGPDVPSKEKQRFKQMTAPLLAQLDNFAPARQLAQLDTDKSAATQTP